MTLQLLNSDTGDISRQTVLAEQYNAYSISELSEIRAKSFAAANLTPASYIRGAPEVIEWMEKNTWLECTLYDHDVPPSAVTPLHLYENDLPWTALTLVFDPYDCEQYGEITNPHTVQACYSEKSERYLMKSLRYTDVEIGWLCYNVCNGMYVLHHNQIRGTIRDRLTPNEQTWVHRFLVRSFCTMIPAGSVIVAPDSLTLSQYICTRPDLIQIPTLPFSRHVLSKSGFHKIDGNQLQSIAPSLWEQLVFTSAIPHQTYWIKHT